MLVINLNLMNRGTMNLHSFGSLEEQLMNTSIHILIIIVQWRWIILKVPVWNQWGCGILKDLLVKGPWFGHKQDHHFLQAWWKWSQSDYWWREMRNSIPVGLGRSSWLVDIVEVMGMKQLIWQWTYMILKWRAVVTTLGWPIPGSWKTWL